MLLFIRNIFLEIIQTKSLQTCFYPINDQFASNTFFYNIYSNSIQILEHTFHNISIMTVINQYLSELPNFSQYQNSFLESIHKTGTIVRLNPSEYINKQFGEAKDFCFLIEGEIDFELQLDREQLNVGCSNKLWTPIGWSGFKAPKRYATTVKSKSDCVLIKWSHEDLIKLFETEISSSILFIKFILEQSKILLQAVREMNFLLPIVDQSDFLELNSYETGSFFPNINIVELLKQSPFFETFGENEILKLASISEKKTYRRGDIIFKQEHKSAPLIVLAQGRVAISYKNKDATCDKTTNRLVSSSGYILSWGDFNDKSINDVSCIAIKDTIIYEIDNHELRNFLNSNPKFSLQFHFRLIWLLSNWLRNERTKYISGKFEKEIKAVRNLIEQNCTQLSVRSLLHKLPHLLSSTYTLSDAFSLIQEVLRSGNSLEKGIANTCYNVLGEVFNELKFYEGLTQVYETVSNAPKEIEGKNARILCAHKFLEVFENVPYVISGEENLPDDAGNIFIFNHLINHPFNTLPNNFQLTLDSHFISSVILFKKYKDPGIRVVRVSRSEEYGHQNYYNKLAHINVFTAESESIEETKEQKNLRREEFYKTASDHLQNGTSLILSPEGTSFSTQDSPGMFRPGAFRLAMSISKEPLIVPIAVANFDKRLNRTKFSVVIKKPFKISEKIKDPANKQEMFDFLKKYQIEYKKHVQEAIDLAK